MRLDLLERALAANESAGARMVLVACAARADDLGRAHGPMAGLGEALGLNRRTLSRALARLERRGHVTLRRTDGGHVARIDVHPRATPARLAAFAIEARVPTRRQAMAVRFAGAVEAARAAGRDARDAVLPEPVQRAVLTFRPEAR